MKKSCPAGFQGASTGLRLVLAWSTPTPPHPLNPIPPHLHFQNKLKGKYRNIITTWSSNDYCQK